MKKTILKSLSVVALSVLCFGFTTKTNTNPDKITICHTPPGNPANCHEITISVNALDTHIDHHGDELVCHNQSEYGYYSTLSSRTGITLRAVF
jgi:hypothetical protein